MRPGNFHRRSAWASVVTVAWRSSSGKFKAGSALALPNGAGGRSECGQHRAGQGRDLTGRAVSKAAWNTALYLSRSLNRNNCIIACAVSVMRCCFTASASASLKCVARLGIVTPHPPLWGTFSQREKGSRPAHVDFVTGSRPEKGASAPEQSLQQTGLAGLPHAGIGADLAAARAPGFADTAAGRIALWHREALQRQDSEHRAAEIADGTTLPILLIGHISCISLS